MKQITTFIFSLFFGIALTTQAQTKFVGGDISLLPSYETNGAIYRDMAIPSGAACYPTLRNKA